MKHLIELASAGDELAFEQLIEQHKAKITVMAFAYTKDYMDAQDIAQESFLKAYQSLHQLKEPAYFSTWLTKIVIRQCFQRLKEKKRDASKIIELQQLQQFSDEPSEHFEPLYEAINDLKEHYRTVILLHYFYDFKLQEIAQLVNKPLNTVKIQLHRARLQLKPKLELQTKRTINQQDVKMMLNNLRNIALQYVAIPENYTLTIEDLNEDGASFFWKSDGDEEGYYVDISSAGKLQSFYQPVQHSDVHLTNEQLQQKVEQFLTSQYPQALTYYSLHHTKHKENSIRFRYKQLVHGLPLDGAYCAIEVAHSGQIMEFEYKPYQEKPPEVPATFADKAPILEQLKNAEWTLQLEYLSTNTYNVPKSGLYAVYAIHFLYHSFDAATGEDLLKIVEDSEYIEETPTIYVDIPDVQLDEPLATIEEIIGIPSSMELIREEENEQGYVAKVWRDKAYEPPQDKSMDQFVLDRFEHTVKANVHGETGQIQGFIWFKERIGELSLTFQQCELIAAKFIRTYFSAFVPYLKLKVKDPSFNEANRAIFHFGVFVQGLKLDGEFFMLSVNKTTGLIDMLMGPKMSVNVLREFTPQAALPFEEVQEALDGIDVVLEWDKRYDQDEPYELLIYRFKERGTNKSINYINATNGALISMHD